MGNETQNGTLGCSQIHPGQRGGNPLVGTPVEDAHIVAIVSGQNITSGIICSVLHIILAYGQRRCKGKGKSLQIGVSRAARAAGQLVTMGDSESFITARNETVFCKKPSPGGRWPSETRPDEGQTGSKIWEMSIKSVPVLPSSVRPGGPQGFPQGKP